MIIYSVLNIAVVLQLKGFKKLFEDLRPTNWHKIRDTTDFGLNAFALPCLKVKSDVHKDSPPNSYY